MTLKKILNKKSIATGTMATLIAGTIIPNVTAYAADANLLSENFESGTKNWKTEKGQWSTAKDGSNVFKQTSLLSEGIASSGEKSWTDYSVEADITVQDFNKNNRVSLCGRYNDNKNYYSVSISPSSDGRIELRKKVNGSSTILAKANVSISENTKYNVKLSMKGNTLTVYLNGKQVLQTKDSSFVKGSIALLTEKSKASYDNVIVSSLNGSSSNSSSSNNNSSNNSSGNSGSNTNSNNSSSNSNSSNSGTSNNNSSNSNSSNSGASSNNSSVSSSSLSAYSVAGFSTGNNGGGVIDEKSSSYKKVTNATELADALKKNSGVKVIEIANDIDLGWNEIASSAKSNGVITSNTSALVHPTLKKTGVSKISIDGFNGLTIYSKNGSTLKHAGFVAKNSSNLVIRNLSFDELWEWDENTKGNYDRNDWDYLTLEGCKKVWIDHCTFGKAYDGVIDSKKGTTGLTISYSSFLPGDMNSAFYKAQFDELEKNINSYPMYKTIRNQGLSKENVMRIASPQKKTHLIGAREFDSTNSDLEVTLHHNYYKDSQDRMPRLRGGNAHIYNIVIDSTTASEYSKLLTSTASKNITSAGYHFGITSNGCLSTEGGALMVEKSQILGVKNPMKNNQKSASKSEYTGKILASDVIYKYGSTNFRGDSTSSNSPLAPEGADKALSFSWNGFSKLPYSYKTDDPSTLMSKLTGSNGAGSGKLNLTSAQWLKTTY